MGVYMKRGDSVWNWKPLVLYLFLNSTVFLIIFLHSKNYDSLATRGGAATKIRN